MACLGLDSHQQDEMFAETYRSALNFTGRVFPGTKEVGELG